MPFLCIIVSKATHVELSSTKVNPRQPVGFWETYGKNMHEGAVMERFRHYDISFFLFLFMHTSSLSSTAQNTLKVIEVTKPTDSEPQGRSHSFSDSLSPSSICKRLDLLSSIHPYLSS